MLNRRDFVRGAAATLGAMPVMSSEMVKAAQEPTMSLNVIYPKHEGSRFDTGYYRFPSFDALKAAVANPAMAEVRADVAKFTDIKPTVMFGKSV